MHRLCIPFVLLFATGCGHTCAEKRAWDVYWKAPQSVAIPETQSWVPLVKDESGQLYLRAESDATEVFLNVDTGFPQPVFEKSFARAHGIECRRAKYTGKSQAGRFSFDMGILPDLRIGTAAVEGVSAIFTDLPERYAVVPGHGSFRVDGILGGAVLPAMRARIDFARKRLSFGAVDLPAGAVILPLSKSDSGILLYVELRLARTNLLLIADTGSNATILDEALMSKDGITPVPGHAFAAFLGTQYRIKAGVVSECHLGAVSLRDRRFYFMELDSSGWRRDVETVAHRSVHGVLGADLLSEFGAIIDYEQGCLILTQPPTKRVETNRRLPLPLATGWKWESMLCSPPLLSAAGARP